MHRSSPRPLRRRSAALLAFVFGCTSAPAPEDANGPENGQTGSPGIPVPPDYDTPGFRPPPPPPGQGPSPTFPERPLWPHEQTARVGSTLYVAERDRGVLVFDISDPANPAERGDVDVSGEPLWVQATESGLWVAATGLDVERQRVVDRLLFFGVENAERPTELSRVDLDGSFTRARAVEGGVVLVTAIKEALVCSAEWGPEGYWVPTTEFEFSAFSADGGNIEPGAELRVAGDGYVELPEGFAVTLGQVRQTQSLQLVQVDAAREFTVSDRVDFAESLVPSTPMQLHDGSLRLFEFSGADLLLTEVSLADPDQRRSAVLPASANCCYPFGPDGSGFSGDLALVSVASDAGEGAPVISFAREAPEVVFTFDVPVTWFFPVQPAEGEAPETWLGFAQSTDGAFELVRFDLPPDGNVAITGRLQLPNETLGASWGPPLWVDEAARRALVPYFATPPAEGLLLGSVSLVGEMAWQPGDSTVVSGFQRAPRSLENPTYWVAEEYERPSVLAGLVNLGGNEAPDLVSAPLGKHLSSLVAREDQVAAIEQRAGESWLVHGPGDFARELLLDHPASIVRFAGDDLLAGGLGTQSECVGPTSPCVSAPPRFSIVDESDDVRGTFELPWVEVVEDPNVSTVVEWLEVVLGPEGAGLLQRRGFSCRSQAACEANDIPYVWETYYGAAMNDDDPAPAPMPMQRAQGQIDEMWLYPVDVESASLGEPGLLDRLDAYEFVTADGFVQEHGFSLLSAHEVVHREDLSGIESAKLSLLSPRQETASLPLRGWPVAVLDESTSDGALVITLEPGAPDGGDTLHALVLDGEQTFLRASLDLGDGYRAHAWGSKQGYVLSQSADLCASDRHTRLRVARSNPDGLTLVGELQIEGHGWRFLAQTDERVVLEQAIDTVSRLAIVDVSGEPTLIGERVLGGAWYGARNGVVVGDRTFVAARTGGLVELGE